MALKVIGVLGAILAVSIVLNYAVKSVAKQAIENSSKSTFPTSQVTFSTVKLNAVQYRPKPAVKSVGPVR